MGAMLLSMSPSQPAELSCPVMSMLVSAIK